MSKLPKQGSGGPHSFALRMRKRCLQRLFGLTFWDALDYTDSCCSEKNDFFLEIDSKAVWVDILGRLGLH